MLSLTFRRRNVAGHRTVVQNVTCRVAKRVM